MRTMMCVLVAMMLVALAVAGASADPVLAREVAMGFTQVGLGDGPNAFLSNPAGLPRLADYNRGMKSTAAIGARVDDEDGDAWSALYSAASGSKAIGWGAGFWQTDSGGVETDYFGLGLGGDILRAGGLTGGVTMINQNVSAGAVNGADAGVDDDRTILNIGLMYYAMPGAETVRVGARLNDVTDELPGDVTVDLGASVRLPQGLLVALDVRDVADEVDTTANVGAEYELPNTGLVVRAGAADGDLTVGGGYRWATWEAGVGWADLDQGEQAVVSFTGWW